MCICMSREEGTLLQLMRRTHPQHFSGLCPPYPPRCAQCLELLNAQNELEPPPPIKPNIDDTIRYGLIQDPPTILEFIDSRRMSKAQQQKVILPVSQRTVVMSTAQTIG